MKPKKFRISTDVIVLAAFGLLAVSLAWNTSRAIYRNYELQQRVNQLQAEIELLEVQNRSLAYEIEFYKTDTYLELEAREKFNKAEKGEKLALLEKNAGSLPLDTNSATRSQTQQTNFQLWLDFLMGRVTGGI